MNTPTHTYLQSILQSIPDHFTDSERAFSTHVLRQLIWEAYHEPDAPLGGDLFSEMLWDVRHPAKDPARARADEALLADIHEAFAHIPPSPSPIPLLGSSIQAYHCPSTIAPIYDEDKQRFSFSEGKRQAELWGDEQPSPAVRDFFASHEQWHHWSQIPRGLLKACSQGLDKLSAQSFYEILPAHLAASLMVEANDSWCSAIVRQLTLDPRFYSEREQQELEVPLLDARQRAVVLRYVNRYRAASPLWNMSYLLPWECPLYLAQQEHARPIHWLRATYPELGAIPLPSEPRIEHIRASIPSTWSSEDREELENFLDRITDHLLSPWCLLDEEGEPKSWDSLPAAEQQLLRQIDEAFADVSDEGCDCLLLTGEAKDDYLEEHILQFLSTHELRGDWRDLPLDWISACECSLSYVDAVGYRYLLPAFLRADFLVDFSTDMSIKLSASENLWDHQLSKSELLNERQRQVVENFMHYRRRNPDWYCDDYLLAWEMRDYLAQDEHTSPQAWLRARYPEIYA